MVYLPKIDLKSETNNINLIDPHNSICDLKYDENILYYHREYVSMIKEN